MFYHDTVIGTDSHRTMTGGLGVAGWGVGGTKANALSNIRIWSGNFTADTEVKIGLFKTNERMYPDIEDRVKVDEQLEKFKKVKGMFGMSMAILTREKKQPVKFFDYEITSKIASKMMKEQQVAKRERGPRNLNAANRGKRKVFEDDNEVELIEGVEEEDEEEFDEVTMVDDDQEDDSDIDLGDDED
ncbi:hypothetical protein LOK49_LG14G00176 [Camellia lanceoleosa]|uniref:Uncharacterized protein n=1 Tax=Camellia lanceoleosa TaxID=1840588 RepID=A0ACC0FDW8_9ERIC|nr:hypothetical protein LOK49_LG14G00176 [Camellia lanceoleosa]